VVDEFTRRLPVTLEVLILSFIFTNVFGIFGGVMAATRQDSIWDYLFRFSAVFGASVPGFLLLTLMLVLPALWFGYSPPFGATDFFEEPVENLKLFVPPTLMLSIGASAGLIRLTRTAMLDVLRQDYMRTARSKGLAGREIILRHAFPNAVPVILTFMALRLAFLLEGSVILEYIMGIPGLGTWALAAIQVKDYPVVMLFSLYAAASLMLISLAVDLLYAYLDPRIRYS
jgi:peptide/nickel transport system permease protein